MLAHETLVESLDPAQVPLYRRVVIQTRWMWRKAFFECESDDTLDLEFALSTAMHEFGASLTAEQKLLWLRIVNIEMRMIHTTGVNRKSDDRS